MRACGLKLKARTRQKVIPRSKVVLMFILDLRVRSRFMNSVITESASIEVRAPSRARIATLDGWRGIAILLVLFDHIQLGTFGRNLVLSVSPHGVAIFFVLSGFLITSLLRDEALNDGKISLARFYVRRFLRLMPAAWVYLFAVTLLPGALYRARPGRLGARVSSGTFMPTKGLSSFSK